MITVCLRDCKNQMKSAISWPNPIVSMRDKDQAWKGSKDEFARDASFAAHHSMYYAHSAASLENCHLSHDNLLQKACGYDPVLTVSKRDREIAVVS